MYNLYYRLVFKKAHMTEITIDNIDLGSNYNTDKDSVDMLPLSEISLGSKTLKKAKLVKNARMETALELHDDPLSGKLQISPDSISDFMNASPKDQEIVRKLSRLHSFDVYSLREDLKELGVEVDNGEALELSDNMKEQLSVYSLEFISPLIEKVFGSDRDDLKTSEGLQKILRDTDVSRVKENLKTMSEKTKIPLQEIPNFLQEYSDVFLSVAYYRHSFEAIYNDLQRFLKWMNQVRTSREISSESRLLKQCKHSEAIVRFILASIRERLAQFHSSFEMFWQDINRESFMNMRRQIEDNHGTMGAVLCGLIVKMNLWREQFPNNDVGVPVIRMRFINSELGPGLEILQIQENEARKKLGLSHF